MSKRTKATAAKPLPNHHGGNREFDVLDTTPMEIPAHACRPPSMQEMIARAVSQAVDYEKQAEHETWDEANDFEEEDPDVLDFSPYELPEVHDEENVPLDVPLQGDTSVQPSEALSEPVTESGPPDQVETVSTGS